MDVNTKAKKLTDNIVLTLRKRVANGESIDYRAEAKRLNVSDFSIGRAMRGITYTHLDRLVPPVRRRPKTVDRTQDILVMHGKGCSTDCIARTLHVGKNTVTRVVRVFNEKERERVELQKARVIKLYLEGKTKYTDIAAQENITINQINKWCAGLKSSRVQKPKAIHNRPKRAPFAEHPYAKYRYYTYPTNGHIRVRLIPEDGLRILTMQRSRYNMAVHLGRVLTKEERVLKRDGDSDDISNLKLVTKRPGTKHNLVCEECGDSFVTKNKHAKVCSVKCSGTYRAKKKIGQPGYVFTRECVVCEENFQTKNSRAEVCNNPACAEIIAKAGFD